MTSVFDVCSERRFAAAFAALTGECGPFRWQLRLLRRMLGANLPKAVDVPTGLGKTAVMALWLIAVAEGAGLPRRLVYVVDRRAVVDQATRFAEQLRCNMPTDLAEKLLLDQRADGLPISTLRGGFADNRDWLEDPSVPAIVVGTIDMIGSRLLFEGYGVSRRMRPYHAGMLGVDSLVVLDEAHLCPPFEALLRQIAEQRDGKLGPLGTAHPTPPFQLMSLSATGRDTSDLASESIFRLEDEDRNEPTVHQRLVAKKRLKVTELTDPKSLTERMAKRAVEIGTRGLRSRVLVYCHSRTHAVDIKNRIDKELNQGRRRAGTAKHMSELLVGERRVHERSELEGWLNDQGLLGGTEAPCRTPTFLVATSAGEVGVDLDADHMVCDLVAYERMVQRLGRVNRRGGMNRSATVDVFALRPQIKDRPKKAKESGEKALEVFEKQLAPLSRLRLGEDGRLDACPLATVELKSKHPEVVSAATTPTPLYPALSRPLVDAWAMTSLERHEGRPEVRPWLRGWEDEEEPQTGVVWRKHLPCLRTTDETAIPPAMVAGYFRSVPVHTSERLEAESTRVFDWLLKRADQLGKREQNTINDAEIMALVLDRDGDFIKGANFGQLKHLAAPARTLGKAEVRRRNREKDEWKRHLAFSLMIVDARICGCRNGMLDEKDDGAVATADADDHWSEIEDLSSETSRPLIRFRVRQVSANEGDEGLSTPEAGEDWRHVRTFETRMNASGMATQGLAVYKWHDDAEDEDNRSILSAPQLLRDHAEQVATRTRQLAERLGLAPHEAKALVAAARFHDDGKAAKRWQRAMNAPDDGIYAKTKGGGNPRLLEGYRHEFGSLLMAEQRNLPDGMRDLILHLIAAHHGYARPLIGCEGCEDGPPSYLESKAGDAALRFARLQKAYGPWGLAWREAILRAADQAVSREWSNRHRQRNDG